MADLTVRAIHVGLPKTATTTLQRAVFACHPGLRYLGRPYPDAQLAAIMDAVMGENGEDYDGARQRAALDAYTASVLADERPILLSDERLTDSRFVDQALIAERLRALFGPARIIVTVRNQLDLLKSLYVYRMAATNRFYRDMEEWLAEEERAEPGRLVGLLRYDRLVDLYAGLFGSANVHVLLTEQLAADPEAFFARLCPILGIDAGVAAALAAGRRENARVSRRLLLYRALRRRIFPRTTFSRFYPSGFKRRFDLFLAADPDWEPPLPADRAAELSRMYGESNRRLAADCALPLGTYGYPL